MYYYIISPKDIKIELKLEYYIRPFWKIIYGINKYFEFKNSWGCRPPN